MGESVAKVFSPGSSRARSITTCLMSELPKEMPASPAWQLEME